MKFQVGFNIVKYKEALLLEELIEVKGTLGVVDLLLQHLAEILNIDIRVLNYLVRCLTDEDYSISSLMQEKVNYFQDELRFDWKEHLG